MKEFNKDRPVYIVGGGPSLKGFDWDLLKGEQVIAINRAHEFIPFADILYWSDTCYYMDNIESIRKFKGLKYTVCRLDGRLKDIIKLDRATKWGCNGVNEAISFGNNSGYAAINLASILGAREVILLGYDMMNRAFDTHFHSGYSKLPIKDIKYVQDWVPRFEQLYRGFTELGVTILNGSNKSRLDFIPYIDPMTRLNKVKL